MVDKLNRRDFISATAVAGAAMLLEACNSNTGEQPAAIRKSSLNTINVALVGYGEEGKILLESLLNIEGVRIVALCDIWDYHRGEGQRYLQKLGNEVRTYENYEDLLAKEKDLQAVLIATPDFWHAPMTNTCLKAGLHVYCEKMMSMIPVRMNAGPSMRSNSVNANFGNNGSWANLSLSPAGMPA